MIVISCYCFFVLKVSDDPYYGANSEFTRHWNRSLRRFGVKGETIFSKALSRVEHPQTLLVYSTPTFLQTFSGVILEDRQKIIRLTRTIRHSSSVQLNEEITG